MESTLFSPVLAALGDYITWWQAVLIVVLIVLIVVFFKLRNRQT